MTVARAVLDNHRLKTKFKFMTTLQDEWLWED